MTDFKFIGWPGYENGDPYYYNKENAYYSKEYMIQSANSYKEKYGSIINKFDPKILIDLGKLEGKAFDENI